MPDVLDGGVESVDDPNRHDVVEVFRVPVDVGRRPGVGHEGPRTVVPPHLHPRLAQPRGRSRQESGGHRRVHEERFHGVAHAHALSLRVDGEGRGHVEVGARIHIDVTEALVMLEDGYGGALGDQPHELLAATRDDEVDQAVEREHGHDRRAIGGVHDLHRVGGQASLLHGLAEHVDDGRIGSERLAAAAQQYRVARLEAEAGGVGRDVGARLVDEANDAQRDADARDVDSVRPAPGLHGLAHGVGQRGDLAQPCRHPFDACLRERQPVEKGGGEAGRLPAREVGAVGLEHRSDLLLEPAGHLQQRLVLGPGRREGQRAGRFLRRPRFRGHVRRHVHSQHPPGPESTTRLSRWMTSASPL